MAGAIYYPNVTVQDVNWLKATLLSFGQVKTMVPLSAELRLEDPEVVKFRHTQATSSGCLLDHAFLILNPDSADTIALNRLADVISEKKGRLVETLRDRQYRWPVPPVRLYRGKLPRKLEEVLKECELAADDGGYLMVNAKVAEASLSIAAIALASESGYEIVAEDEHLHYGLVTRNEQYVIDALMNNVPGARVAPNVKTVSNEIVQVTLLTNFDFSQIDADALKGILEDNNSLEALRKAAAKLAENVPSAERPEVRQQFIDHAANEILTEWKKISGAWPRRVMDAVTDASKIASPKWLESGLVATACASHPYVLLGIAVVVSVYSGVKVYRAFREQEHHGYRYLSRIVKAGAALTQTPSMVR